MQLAGVIVTRCVKIGKQELHLEGETCVLGSSQKCHFYKHNLMVFVQSSQENSVPGAKYQT